VATTVAVSGRVTRRVSVVRGLRWSPNEIMVAPSSVALVPISWRPGQSPQRMGRRCFSELKSRIMSYKLRQCHLKISKMKIDIAIDLSNMTLSHFNIF
jgi:hypothetical protein